MLRNIGNFVYFIIVLMTSHHVTGQAHDVTQLNRRLTILKNSVDDDIGDIRLEIMDLKMIVEQIVLPQILCHKQLKLLIVSFAFSSFLADCLTTYIML